MEKGGSRMMMMMTTYRRCVEAKIKATRAENVYNKIGVTGCAV